MPCCGTGVHRKATLESFLVLQPDISEKDFQKLITDYASFMQWTWIHQRPGLTQSGRWLTAISGQAGFPDLVLARERIVFAEIKTARGRMSDNQKLWRDALVEAGAEWYMWRPKDWEKIQKILR